MEHVRETRVCIIEIPAYRSGQLIFMRFKCSWFLNLGIKEDTKKKILELIQIIYTSCHGSIVECFK